MRRAMMDAVVGDHVLGDDPTANELEEVCARVLGKDWAFFMPSGTMANQVAVLIGSRPGTEIVVDAGAHLVHFEDAGAAASAGVQLRPVASHDGVPDSAAFEAAIRESSRFVPETSLLWLENTHNFAGGRLTSVERMAEIAEIARQRGIPIHLDGARLPNAAVAAGRDMKEWTTLADTVMVSLSKGLGAPIGSVLAGPKRLMDAAWRARRRLGGGMRQAGLLAAAGLHALHHNFDRLDDDHRRATALANGIRRIPGLTASTPDTNIVMIDVEPSLGNVDDLLTRLLSRGVLLSRFGPRRLRAVTHLDIDDAAIELSISALSAASSPAA